MVDHFDAPHPAQRDLLSPSTTLPPGGEAQQIDGYVLVNRGTTRDRTPA
jgi:hypothetical protein